MIQKQTVVVGWGCTDYRASPLDVRCDGIKCQAVINERHSNTGQEPQMVQDHVESSGDGVFCELICPLGKLIWIKVLGEAGLKVLENKL